MFLTDFKCLHDFFYARWRLCPSPPVTFLIMQPQLGPFLPRRNRTRHYLLRELVTIKGAVVRALASHQCHPVSNSGVDAICGWVFVGSPLCPAGFFPRYPSIPFPSRLKKKIAKNGRRRTTTCWCRIPVNRDLFVIVCYLSYITKPSKKCSSLMIMLMTS